MPEYKSLYRKYRPKTFSDVYGQEHITKILKNQIANQKVSHAYLFCGSRGTGKTTCAKILAKAVNCENANNGDPCNKCDMCLGIESGRIIDVIEIDAASNNGVDNIREIREDAAYTPGDSSKKVYIIDEVHMLSAGAFNALLKTLEEPPPHIIFILATTEINKIPATILSRCQRHDFRRIPPEVIAELLKNGCEKENIKIEDKAIDLIARLANGAARDAWNILEACSVSAGDDRNVTQTPGSAEPPPLKRGQGIITFEYVSKVSGYFDSEKMVNLCVCIKNGDAANALRIFWEMYDNSVDCNNFCASLLEMFRNIQVAKIAEDPVRHINLEKSEAEKIIEISKSFDSAEIMRCNSVISEVIINLGRFTVNKRVAVEMMIVEMCMFQLPPSNGAPGTSRPTTLTPPSAKMEAGDAQKDPLLAEGVGGKAAGGSSQTPRYFDRYADLIEEIGKENKMLPPYMKSGKCVIDESAKKIIIYLDNEFKANILKEAKNIAVIQNNLAKFAGGGDYAVAVELKKPDIQNAPDSVGSIDDIIGYAE